MEAVKASKQNRPLCQNCAQPLPRNDVQDGQLRFCGFSCWAQWYNHGVEDKLAKLEIEWSKNVEEVIKSVILIGDSGNRYYNGLIKVIPESELSKPSLGIPVFVFDKSSDVPDHFPVHEDGAWAVMSDNSFKTLLE